MSNLDKYKRYADFGVEDFMQDPFYQDSIIQGTEEQTVFWQGFLAAYPAKLATLERARGLLKVLSFKEEFPDDDRVQESFSEHLLQAARMKEQRIVRMHNRRRWLRVAAVFGGVLLCAAVLLMHREHTMTAQTGFGKLKTVLLPDSSTVVLNANSKIEYAAWQSKKAREVWLEGEAFFQVRHRNQNPVNVQPGDRFLLHTKDITVEVLGTSFDVRQRRQKTEVMLQTGSIKISFANGERPNLFMKPGDAIVYDAASKAVVQTTTVPENYTGWKEKKLMLLNPSVNEIIGYLQDNFGKRIDLQSPQLGEIKIEGPILLNNLNDALFILSTVLKADISEKNNAYVIRALP